VLAAGPSTNGTYIGTLKGDNFATGTALMAPNYVTPRSVQMNVGVQRELRRGMVATVDFLRNVSTHNFLLLDTNHVGDARFFDKAAAQAAIAATNAHFGCATVTCAIAAGAHITDYASNGLDSGYSLCSGLPCVPNGAPAAAFPGINPNVGANEMNFPIGRSVYNGLQATLKEDTANPLPGIKHANLQVSYAFSRYVATARDGDFSTAATDFANPTHFIGPNALDRTHQISFGGYVALPWGFQLGAASHFDSPLPASTLLPPSGAEGGIFQTDVTGDGTGDGATANNRGLGDPLPGTNLGSFGRDFGPKGLNQLISNFNSTMVGQPTPAGQVLIQNGLFTLAQLQALGGVIGGNTPGNGLAYGPLSLAPANAIGQTWLRTFDLNMSWAYKIKERFTIQPGVAFFNVFNFSNFDGPAVPFNNTLNLGLGSANGTTSAALHSGAGNFLRLGLGSGVNALGAPRAIEWQLKIAF
jgi:hypothetical protein